MSNETKISLRNVLTALTIAIVLASIVVTCSIAIENTKAAKIDIVRIESDAKEDRARNDARMDALELKYERFEGIIEERTRNTQNDVREIMSDMKILLHRLKLEDD